MYVEMAMVLSSKLLSRFILVELQGEQPLHFSWVSDLEN